MDFTLGQWLGSNGDVFVIYSCSKDGKITSLPIEDNSSVLFISNHDPSVMLDKLSKDSFGYEYYNQMEGKYFTTEIKWDGIKVVKLKTKEKE